MPESPILWTGVAGNPALSFSAVGILAVLREGLGVAAPSLSSTDSTGVVGRSCAAVKGGASANTGGQTSLYTKLTMLGRNKESVKTPGT